MENDGHRETHLHFLDRPCTPTVWCDHIDAHMICETNEGENKKKESPKRKGRPTALRAANAIQPAPSATHTWRCRQPCEGGCTQGTNGFRQQGCEKNEGDKYRSERVWICSRIHYGKSYRCCCLSKRVGTKRKFSPTRYSRQKGAETENFRVSVCFALLDLPFAFCWVSFFFFVCIRLPIYLPLSYLLWLSICLALTSHTSPSPLAR